MQEYKYTIVMGRTAARAGMLSIAGNPATSTQTFLNCVGLMVFITLL
jgi:hypothetical protein